MENKPLSSPTQCSPDNGSFVWGGRENSFWKPLQRGPRRSGQHAGPGRGPRWNGQHAGPKRGPEGSWKRDGVEVQVLVGAALPAASAPFQRQLGQAEQRGPYAGQR